MSDGRTHWEGCEREHLSCALAQLDRARAERDALERERDALREAVAELARNFDALVFLAEPRIIPTLSPEAEATVIAVRQHFNAATEPGDRGTTTS